MGRAEREARKGNPWYTSPQFQALAHKAQRQTIQRRWAFFTRHIERQLATGGREQPCFLDAGCGDGVNLSLLTRFDDVTVYACDYNPLRLARVKERFPSVRVSGQDLLHPDFGGTRFDVILCSQVLEHIPQDDAALAGLKGLLKPDGLLIVGVPNEGCLPARIRNGFLQPSLGRTTDHVHFYRYAEFRNQLVRHGFRVADVLREGFFFPHTRLHGMVRSSAAGFALADVLGSAMPFWAGGMYFAVRLAGRSAEGGSSP